MKAIFYIHGINPEQHAIITIKLQQWQEFLEAAGMIASFAVEDDAPPAADLWQAAQEEATDNTPTVIEHEQP